MKKTLVKLKKKIVSFIGAMAIVFVSIAVALSFVGENNKNLSFDSDQKANAYAEENYVTYADDLIADIEEKNSNLYSESYSLKDDYIVLAENQTTSKLCWAYSGLKVLETTLMVQTQEYYNFSEMSVAYFAYLDKLNGTIDSFGSFRKLDETIKDKGIVNESDFSNDNYGKINETNHTKFSWVESYADKNLPKTVAPIYLSRNVNFKSSNNEENIIKYYIKNIGGLNIALPAGSMFRNDQTTGKWVFDYNVTSDYEGKTLNENHAVCLIGWNSTGFIGLNSWGVDVSSSYEEIIIPYSIMNKYYRGDILFNGSVNNDWLCGYNYIGNTNVKIESTSADEFTTTILERNTSPLKNVFLLTEKISMSFKLENVTNFETIYLSVYKSGEDVTSHFTISYDDVNNLVTLLYEPKASNFGFNASFFAGGNYSLRFYEDVKLLTTKSITIYTGVEVSYIRFENSTTNSTDPENFTMMNTIASNKSTDIQYIYYEDSYAINMYLTELGKLSKVTNTLPVSELVKVNGFSVYNEETGEFEIQQNDSYLVFDGNLSSTGNCYKFKLRFLSSDLTGKLIKFIVYIRSPYYYDTCIKQFNFMFYVSGTKGANTANRSYNVIYNLDGGKNNAVNVDIYPQYISDSMTDFILCEPSKQGYTFDGWYLDSTYETEITKIDANLSGNIFIYAKWIYNNTIYFDSSLGVSAVYNYDGTLKNIADQNLNETATLVYGESIKFQANFEMKDTIKTETFTFKYYFYINGDIIKEISLINSSDMGSVQTNYSVDFGGLDDENLAFPNLEAGNYQIGLISVAVIRHKFSITQTNIFTLTVNQKEVTVDYNANASIFTYDANSHKPTASFAGYYEEDSADFAELSFVGDAKIDAGDYAYFVNDITNSNYILKQEDKIREYWLYINKKPLTLEFKDTSVYYNGKRQKPKCEVIGLINNERTEVNLDSNGYINAGTYRFIAKTISNSNYSIIENQPVDFEIKKAPLTVKFHDVEERAQSSLAYRTQITYSVVGTLYDSIESLEISCSSNGLTETEAGEYPIVGSYNKDNSNYDISFIQGSYVLTGYYYVYYTLPDGNVVKELVNYGETPLGVTNDMIKLSPFQKLELSTELVETGDDIYVVVSVKDYSWYMIIAGLVLGFIVIYFVITHRSRHNKVR